MTEAVILGRQPDKLWIAPSKPNPWYGTIVEGDDLTVEQREYLNKRNIERTPLVITVKRSCTDREMVYPFGRPVPEYHFQCPVVGRREDGWISIISPSGLPAFVAPNGYINGRPRPIRSAFR